MQTYGNILAGNNLETSIIGNSAPYFSTSSLLEDLNLLESGL